MRCACFLRHSGRTHPAGLELARPVTDLRAARKGDQRLSCLDGAAQTTDHQTVRHPGPTRICRSLNLEIGDCKTPAAEIPAAQFPIPAFDSKRGAPAPRIQATYTDTLPQELQTQNPTAQITYAVSVLNESGRSAGLSNLVQVPVCTDAASARSFPCRGQERRRIAFLGVLSRNRRGRSRISLTGCASIAASRENKTTATRPTQKSAM